MKKKNSGYYLKILLLLFSLLSGKLYSFCQYASIKVEVSKDILVPGETFQVHFIIEDPEAVKNFKVKQKPEFRLIDSFIVNNKEESSEIFTMVQILTPVKTGKLSIPVASAIVKGRKVFSPDVYVEVLSRASGKENVIDQSVLLQGENPERKVKDNFFIKADISKSECFIGENIMAEYKVYNRLNSTSSVSRRPSFQGFSILEMADNYNAAASVEYLNETAFFTHLIRKVHLFPLQEGSFILEPAEIESEIHFKKEEKANEFQTLRNLFEQNGGVNLKPFNYKVVLVSPRAEIKVKPLPEKHQPNGFRGAIGNFIMDILIEDDTNAHQKTLILKISGTGNFPLINPPEIKWPEGVRYHYKGTRENLNYKEFPLSGEKSFIWSMSFSGKNIRIPEISFSYFNAEKEVYTELNSGEILIENINLKKKRFPFLKSGDTEKRDFFYLRYIILALLALALTSYIITMVLRNKAKQSMEQNNSKEDFFIKVDKAYKEENADRFYSVAGEFLKNTATERGIREVSIYDKEDLQQKLIAKGYEPEIAEDFINALEIVQLSKYSPERIKENETRLYELLKKIKTK